MKKPVVTGHKSSMMSARDEDNRKTGDELTEGFQVSDNTVSFYLYYLEKVYKLSKWVPPPYYRNQKGKKSDSLFLVVYSASQHTHN